LPLLLLAISVDVPVGECCSLLDHLVLRLRAVLFISSSSFVGVVVGLGGLLEVRLAGRALEYVQVYPVEK
jgi:hypothetical protein